MHSKMIIAGEQDSSRCGMDPGAVLSNSTGSCATFYMPVKQQIENI